MVSYSELEPQYHPIEGYRLAYYRAGEGPPLLLVHGITTYSFIWRRVFPLLVPYFLVIAVDLLGCGDSDKPLHVDYSLKNHASILHRFIQGLGIQKVHFVGHDVGGGIGQIFAVKYQDWLYDLTLINSVGYDYWPVQPISTIRTPIIRQIVMASLDLGTFEYIIRRGLYKKDHLTSELMGYFRKPLATSAGKKGFLHFARCLDNRDLLEITEDLRHLERSVLILHGEADPYLSPMISRRLHKDIPGSQLRTIPTGSHFVQEDEPEVIADAILQFAGKIGDADAS